MPAAVQHPVPAAAAGGHADDAALTCPWCGSADITPIEWDGPTGVTAPDGGGERRLEEGYRCRACGGVEQL
jgi:hypothetical protein